MSFMFFRKERKGDKLYYINDYDNYSLAGYNLIYQSWIRKGKPINQGWTVTADDLLKTYGKEHNLELCDSETYALVIDFHPSSKNRIGLIEIERIHIYTYGDETRAEWSPLMLELRQVFYAYDFENLSNDHKESLLERIELKKEREQIVEFLYLNGDDYSWNWGRNGMTNAVFLDGEARKFFKQFF